jgi:hypothetical protein
VPDCALWQEVLARALGRVDATVIGEMARLDRRVRTRRLARLWLPDGPAVLRARLRPYL